ncbi:MAG: hypothetical protein KTR32_18485 [Granulosicoccus sp.]|nr:hypothetical protein [Granulosicoccus sp.]
MTIKTFLAIAAVVVMSACSSGGNDSNPPSTDNTGGNTGGDMGGNTGGTTGGDTGGNTGGDTGGNATPPGGSVPTGGGTPPATGTKAGTYIGDFGSGQGVYVVGNDNALFGLALSDDGSAASLFGNLGEGSTFNGALRGHGHDASNPPTAGGFGTGFVQDPPEAFNLNILNGQSIESLSGPAVSLVGATAGQLATANAASLAGNWVGDNQFCDQTECFQFRVELTVSGTNINGETSVINPDGSETFINAFAGGLTDFGDVALISFNWLSNTYNGIAFFPQNGNGQLVFIGETTGETDNKTIASLLGR